MVVLLNILEDEVGVTVFYLINLLPNLPLGCCHTGDHWLTGHVRGLALGSQQWRLFVSGTFLDESRADYCVSPLDTNTSQPEGMSRVIFGINSQII